MPCILHYFYFYFLTNYDDRSSTTVNRKVDHRIAQKRELSTRTMYFV